MSENSTLLTALKAARLALVQKMATGQFVSEYRDGTISIKKESPVALMRELEAQIDRLQAVVDNETLGQRSAAVAEFGGPV